MNETKLANSRKFAVKCKGCGLIYDSIANKTCPECGTSAIRPRLEWSREDFGKAEELMSGDE